MIGYNAIEYIIIRSLIGLQSIEWVPRKLLSVLVECALTGDFSRNVNVSFVFIHASELKSLMRRV